jgi:aspartate kinase
LKFGGTSVANMDRIRNVATKVKREADAGYDVVVVVSAMSGVTNQLVDYVKDARPLYDPAEYDAVVASGEQVTSGLLALALQRLGCQARSWQGWQIPIETNSAHSKARIENIKTDLIQQSLNKGEIVVIPGFQGVDPNTGRITTLGRGGSDTSAVAIAAALKSIRCDIYTDVDGVYTTDPRIVSKARKLKKVAYEEMLEYASLGAKVLQTRSVELAMAHKVRVQVLSSLDETIGSDLPGTLVCDEEEIVEQQLVTGVAYAKDEAKITLEKVYDNPGVASDIFMPLADASINVDMIIQNVSADGKSTDVTFTVPHADIERAVHVLTQNKAKIGYQNIKTDENVSKVSIIGLGMRSHAGVAATMFKALGEKKINVQVISTSEIKISVLIASDYTELAVRALHSAFNLEKE